MDERTQKYVNTLSRMIQKETVSEQDKKDRTKFREFHGLLRELFPNLFKVVEFEDFDGSILLKWKGKSSSNPIMLMNHHDVVEAQGEWKHGPFSGEVADGKLWGRGTLDTKGGLFGMLMAADELAASGFAPNVDIYFESACTEETGGEGAEEISKVLESRGIRFSMVLDEGGMIMYEPIGGAKGLFAMVGMGEKGCAELKFIARGNGGHASTPEKDTPLVRLGKFMAEADKGRLFEVEVSPTIREMLRRLSPTMSGVLKTVMAKPETFDFALKKIMPGISGTAKALLQTTIAFTMAEGSNGRNVIPAEAWVIGNMRVSHHQGYKSSLEAITKLAEKYNIQTVELTPAIDSTLADYKHEGFKLIESAIKNSFDDVIAAPYIMTGASDARFMTRVCENCYHFVPFIIDEQQMESIHGIDENVDVSTLPLAVDFYKYIIREAK